MSPREILLGVTLLALGSCAIASGPDKARDLTSAERDRLSQTLEPLLIGAGLWQRTPQGCAAEYALVKAEPVGVVITPHAPCRVLVLVSEGTLARLDRATLRVLLAHDVAHLQLGHLDARQARIEAQKQTQQGVKTVSRAGSKAVSFIPGVGGLISKGIGTARKAATAAMEMRGNPYLPEEEQAADAMAATLLDEAESSSCRSLISFLEERLQASDEEAWTPWLHEHPVSAERVAVLAAPCPGAERP
jgi:hypothetical protein